MCLLYRGYGTEVFGDFREALVVGYECRIDVEVYAFLAFLADGNRKVFGGCANYARVDRQGGLKASAFKEFEVDFGVAQLVGGCLAEYFAYGEIFFFVGLCGVECVAGIRLRFSQIGVRKIDFGFCPFYAFFVADMIVEIFGLL